MIEDIYELADNITSHELNELIFNYVEYEIKDDIANEFYDNDKLSKSRIKELIHKIVCDLNNNIKDVLDEEEIEKDIISWAKACDIVERKEE